MTKVRNCSTVRAGQKYGTWTTIEKSMKGYQYFWLCRCDCGAMKKVEQYSLSSGRTKGCFNCRFLKHGGAKSPAYNSWCSMRQRCLVESYIYYHNYGGRGIKICDRWIDSFENFLEDMGERPTGTSLDRIDNEKGYEPENCKWSTRIEQQNNRRSTIYVEYEGELHKLMDLSMKLGISRHVLLYRHKNGKQIDAPVVSKKHKGE